MKTTTLDYNLYSLGKREILIYGNYASQCYNFLKENEVVERLKNTEQLGLIKESMEGIHHSRWEYVILQMFLLNRVCDTKKYALSYKFNIHLNNNIENLSGAELIQMWILLLNSGHLYGTFSSERGVLKAINDNILLYRKIKEKIPKDLEVWFEDMVDNCKFYQMNILNSIYFLNTSQKKSKTLSGNKLTDFYIEILKVFIKDNYDDNLNFRIKNYKKLFHTIRQISYLLLDSQYFSLPFKFNLTDFMVNFEENFNEFFSKSSHMDKLLQDYDNLLSSKLYLSDIYLRNFAIHENYVYNKFTGIKYTRHKDIKTDLMSIKFDNDFFNRYKHYDTILKLEFDLDKINNIDIKRYLLSHLNLETESRWRCEFNNDLITIFESNSGNHLIINLPMDSKYIVHPIGKLINNLIEIMNKHISNFIIEDVISYDWINILNSDEQSYKFENKLRKQYENDVKKLFNPKFEEIVLFLLKNLTSDEFLFVLSDDKLSNKVVVVDNKNFNNIENEKYDGIEEYRAIEIDMVLETVKKTIKQSKELVIVSGIEVNDSDNQNKAEFDGLVLLYKENKLFLYFVEGKDSMSGKRGKCRKALRKHLKVFNFKPENLSYDDLDKGCYCEVKL